MSKILVSTAVFVAVSLSASSGPQQNDTPLKDVGDLIIGEWSGEGIYAADYPGVGKKGERFTSAHTCAWIVDQAAIRCDGTGFATSSTSLFWWDAASKQVKNVGVNSGGNYSEGTVAKKGTKLVWESSGSFADGQRVTYKGETTFEDDGNTQISVGATILDGVRNEFRDVYKRVAN